jgi:hypothetical protein
VRSYATREDANDLRRSRCVPLNVAGDEGCLHLRHSVVDRHAGSFVEDLDAEDLHAGSSAKFVGAGQRDVEREDLIGEGRQCFLFEAGDFIEALAAELIDRGLGVEAVATCQRRAEDRVLRKEGVLFGAELRTDVVDVRDVLAAHLVDERELLFGARSRLF